MPFRLTKPAHEPYLSRSDSPSSHRPPLPSAQRQRTHVSEIGRFRLASISLRNDDLLKSWLEDSPNIVWSTNILLTILVIQTIQLGTALREPTMSFSSLRQILPRVDKSSTLYVLFYDKTCPAHRPLVANPLKTGNITHLCCIS